MLIKAKEKKERALGTKLGLKGDRCNSPKCAMIRRPYGPGMHGKRRKRASSEFGEQLKEKQKIRFSYGLKEGQLGRIFAEAAKKTEATGDALMRLLESRLDNVVFRLGFASSRLVARQLVNHRHVLVNGRVSNTPSRRVRIGDVVSLSEKAKKSVFASELPSRLKKHNPPSWLGLDKEKFEGKMSGSPVDVERPFDVDKVIDYYSR